MKEQVMKSEQINSCMQMVIDYDDPLRADKDFLAAYKKALGDNVSILKYQGTKRVFVYDDGEITHYIISAAVTYLSYPHPIFKKRMQLQRWYKDFYNEYKDKPNTTINIMGVYHYDGMEVYCNFNIQDYINKEMHSSSAHVYSNDIYQAVKNGVFEKTDLFGNKITTIKGIKLKDYFSGNVSENPVVGLFKKFNSSFAFDKWLLANTCIKEMLDKDWYQAKGTEWPGWFLEFKVDEFINRENCSSIMLYTGNKNKAEGMLDFDLFFSTLNFYGDLKASDIKKKEAPGNDQQNTLDAISQYGRLWYIVYEHETVKDKDKNSEMAIARMELIDSSYHYSEGDKISYQQKMKHSVKFKKMHIFELNEVNMHEILSDFNQGHNSGPAMAERAAKFLLNKENMNNSIIYSYEI